MMFGSQRASNLKFCWLEKGLELFDLGEGLIALEISGFGNLWEAVGTTAECGFVGCRNKVSGLRLRKRLGGGKRWLKATRMECGQDNHTCIGSQVKPRSEVPCLTEVRRGKRKRLAGSPQAESLATVIPEPGVSQRSYPHVFLKSKTPRSLDFGINPFNQNYEGSLCPPVYIKIAIGVWATQTARGSS